MMDKTPILVGDRFWQQNWSGGPVLAGFSAKIGLAGPILGGTDFGVTGLLLIVLHTAFVANPTVLNTPSAVQMELFPQFATMRFGM